MERGVASQIIALLPVVNVLAVSKSKLRTVSKGALDVLPSGDYGGTHDY
jgi:hypothetical protein